jgi:putative aldouronate transport system substrate-binding protein
MKKLSIVLAFVMLVSFVACSSQSEAPAQTTTGAITTKAQTSAVTTTAAATTTTTKADATTEVQNPFAEKMTINWLVGTYSSHLYEEGRWDELELEEKFNVDIKMWNILVDSNNMEQVQMMLAAGDVPDYGFYYTTGKYMYDNGLGRTIPLKMIQQYYPSYYKLIQEDPLGLSFNLVEGTTDEYYGLALYTPLSRHTGWVPMWRLDWLENLGYEMDNLTVMVSALNPDRWNDRVYFSTTKFTVDEVEELLRAFTEDDPDGNGVDDTYGSPFANSAYDRYISYNMFGFDQDASHFYKDPVTGDYVPYFAYTPYKDNLSFLMRMLDKGYMRWIPGELAYHLELRAIWNTGKVGFMNTLGAPRVLGLGYSDGNEWPPANILNNVDPNATFVITPVPGENGNFRPHQAFNWSTMMYLVGNVSDEKLARIFQMIEYAYFGEDWMRYKWGIEGVHYQWSGESMNSPIIFTDPEKIPPKYAGKGTTAFGQFGNLNFIDNINVYFNFDAFYIQFIEYWNQYSPDGWFGDSLWILPDKLYSQYTMPADKYEEFTELRNETNSQINTVHSEFTKRVWGGQISNIDSEWEQYIDQIYAAGLSEWVKFWNSDDIKTYNYYRQQK